MATKAAHPYPDPKEAKAYLSGFSGLPESPEPRGYRDVVTGLHLARAMELLKRAQRYPDLSRQTNANHSWRLGIMCVQAAGSQREDLDLGKVRIMCDAHDFKELYGGDTPIRNKKSRQTKVAREAAGMAILIVNDLAKNSPLKDILAEYEGGEVPEARFVQAMDKVEPVEFELENGGATHRHHGDEFPWLVETQLPKTMVDPTAFHLMIHGLREVGENWHEWRCKPFDGDPNEIVDGAVHELLHPRLPT